MDNYELLIKKLDQFIRKYYINRLLKGSLFSFGLILGLFIAFNALEYLLYFDRSGRTALLFSFFGISGAAMVFWVAIPLLHFFRLGKIISHEQAAQIIGSHFNDVRDKLLNILQLKKQSSSAKDRELIEASISQKSASVSLVPFKTAIDLQKNRKYLRYALPPFLLLLVILFGAPSVITESSHRIMHNQRDFERPAPFHFVIQEEDLTVIQYEDFVLNVEVDGEKLPNDVFIDVDNYQYRLKKLTNNEFSFTFKNVQASQKFQLFSGNVRSLKDELKVLPKPNLVDFNIHLNYPDYIQRNPEDIQNIGDIVVPVGTRVSWNFNTHNTDKLMLNFSSNPLENLNSDQSSKNSFKYQKRALKEEYYTIYVANEFLPAGDSTRYSLGIIPDKFPSISALSFQDSLEPEVFYFVGNASDDYGLSSLSFQYQLVDESGQELDSKIIKLPEPEESEIQFDYLFDINALQLKPGQRVNYFFEIFDNDGINGRKSAATTVMSYAKPTIEEYKEQEDSNEEDIKSSLEESLDEIKKLQEEMRQMREKLLQEKEMDWQNKKDLEMLLEKQKELEQKLQEAKDKFEENLKNQNEFSNPSEEIKEKQQQLQELFEEVMDEESFELMEKIQELLEELNKENSIQMLEQFEMNEEAMEKNMERLLELFKQLELEKEINEMVEELNQLAEEQEELSDKTQKEESPDTEESQEGSEKTDEGEQSEEGKEQENKEQESNDQKSEEDNSDSQSKEQNQNNENSTPQEQLKQEQEGINDQFEQLKEKMEQIEEMNDNLEFPKQIGDRNEEEMEDIQDELNQSQQQLQQNQNQKASKSQKNAANKMKSMASNLQSQMQQGQMQQMQEDLKTLRQLLENIVTLSFDQEELVDNFGRTNVNTPRYVSLVQDQFRIKDDFRLVEDSLQALSKRVTQIETFVAEKVSEVNYNLEESIDKLEERQKPTASQHQRFTMKNLNDLALMLSESMDNMQQQMAAMMQGNQMCNNPGSGQGNNGQNGQVPLDKITEKQGELKDGLEGMMQKMQNGQGGTAKEFAESAARQAALRKALEEMQRMNDEQGKGTSQELREIIDQMDQNEIDLVNKRLDHEMMNRQQEIITRLLEAEEAERQREYDNKRKGETGTEIKREFPPSLEEYIKKKESETEMYKSISPSLKPYYKQLVEEYYKALKTQSSR